MGGLGSRFWTVNACRHAVFLLSSQWGHQHPHSCPCPLLPPAKGLRAGDSAVGVPGLSPGGAVPTARMRTMAGSCVRRA